jgi:hypothetical protein
MKKLYKEFQIFYSVNLPKKFIKYHNNFCFFNVHVLL